jgi:hypothetical protein
LVVLKNGQVVVYQRSFTWVILNSEITSMLTGCEYFKKCTSASKK